MFGIICAIGMYVRVHHFSDNIFFGLDQARDYRIIDRVVDDIGNFPLVGPKAGGTFFRLGPIFYVPSLVSAYIFGVSVMSVTLPNLIFSLLTLPLAYLFFRECFAQRIALFLMALFAISLFAVEYAYFLWNPNAIPFFIFLLFYAVLRFSRAGSSRSAYVWIGVSAVASAFVMQLHTITLVAVPVTVIVYMIVSRTKISVKQSMFFIAMFVVLFLPLIGNELFTKGENTRMFFAAVDHSEDADVPTTVPKQLSAHLFHFTRFYSIMLTSGEYVSAPIRLESSHNVRDLVTKNVSTSVLRNNMIRFCGSFVLFCIAVVWIGFVAWRQYAKQRAHGQKMSVQKKNFIILLFVWQCVLFVVLYPFALKVDSRYFLPAMCVPFVFVGLFFSSVEMCWRTIGRVITAVLFVGLFCINGVHTVHWLHVIDRYADDYRAAEEEYILESYFSVTHKQWRTVVDDIARQYADGAYSGVYVQASPLHQPALLYLLRINHHVPVATIDAKHIDKNGLHFVLRETKKIAKKDLLPNDFDACFRIVRAVPLGTVTLLQLDIKRTCASDATNRTEVEYRENNKRCYMTDIEIDKRRKCELKDVRHLYDKK